MDEATDIRAAAIDEAIAVCELNMPLTEMGMSPTVRVLLRRFVGELRKLKHAGSVEKYIEMPSCGFQTAGLRAAHLDGETPKAERKRLIARLAIGGQGSTHPEALDVLCNVDVLTEGFDSESSYELVLEDKSLWLGKSHPPEYVPLAVIGDWAPTKSMGKYIQRAVRNCRIHPKKTQAVYLDHSGNINRHCFLVQHEGFTLDDGSDKVKKSLVPVGGKYISLKCLRCNIDLPPEGLCTLMAVAAPSAHFWFGLHIFREGV